MTFKLGYFKRMVEDADVALEIAKWNLERAKSNDASLDEQTEKQLFVNEATMSLSLKQYMFHSAWAAKQRCEKLDEKWLDKCKTNIATFIEGLV